MSENNPICIDNGVFTSVLLQPDGHLGYFGTSDGCVEIWDLEIMEKNTEVRYLVFNEFNEQVPIKEPVVNLAAPSNFEFVYAFMGIAAYCIDTKLRTIVQQIPISEKVVWGAVSPVNGEIGVLTTSGYLSRWSPKFFERTGSIEFEQKVEKGFLLHDFDEARIIMVLGEDKVVLGNLEGERYTMEFDLPISNEFLNSSKYDTNPFYTVGIRSGCVYIYKNEDENIFDIPDILSEGRVNSEFKLRKIIQEKETENIEKNYISDLRLHRESRDRYNAEVDSLGKDIHYQNSITDDSKTLHFALQEYHTDNVESKSMALSVVNKLGNKYNTSKRSLQFAFLLNTNPHYLITESQLYDELTIIREAKLRKYIVISLLLSLILLFFSSSFTIDILELIILGSIGIVQLFAIIYIRSINFHPKLHWVKEYKGLRFLNSLTLLFALIIATIRFLGVEIPFIDNV